MPIYRHVGEETPSYTGGVSRDALDRIHSRAKRRDGHGLYVSSDKGKREGRRKEVESGGSSRRGHHRPDTPLDTRFKDMRTPSRSSWDEDVTATPIHTSAWDVMTPSSHTSSDISTRKHVPKDTPLPTPTHRYNVWERKSFGVKKPSKCVYL